MTILMVLQVVAVVLLVGSAALAIITAGIKIAEKSLKKNFNKEKGETKND